MGRISSLSLSTFSIDKKKPASEGEEARRDREHRTAQQAINQQKASKATTITGNRTNPNTDMI
jgi:hypothetical protein